MLMGPKITYVTKYGAKVSLRYSFWLWMLDRDFAKKMRAEVRGAWSNEYDIMTFRSHGAGAKVIRVCRDDCALLKLGWF